MEEQIELSKTKERHTEKKQLKRVKLRDGVIVVEPDTRSELARSCFDVQDYCCHATNIPARILYLSCLLAFLASIPLMIIYGKKYFEGEINKPGLLAASICSFWGTFGTIGLIVLNDYTNLLLTRDGRIERSARIGRGGELPEDEGSIVLKILEEKEKLKGNYNYGAI